MIAIEVTLLTGRYVATAHHDRYEHEWPPHPARLFSALVSAWADAETPDAAERAALEWLEALGAPTISASLPGDVAVRTPVSYFVPVNDAAVATGSATAARVLPDGVLPPSTYAWHKKRGGSFQRDGERGDWITGRGKQERQFPSVTPPCAIVTFTWDDTPDPLAAGLLDDLLARVTRIGHSSSLVSCRLVDDVPEPTLRPGVGSIVLRCTQSGQLAALEAAHRRHEGVHPRALPFVGVRYSEQSEADVSSVGTARPDNSGDLVVFEIPIDRRSLPAIRTAELTEALRGAVFYHADDPPPEGLSGHLPDGRPSRHPHVAFIALPNVGHDYADGRIMGLAVMLPEALSENAARAAYRAIGKWEQAEPRYRCRLTLGGGQAIDLQRRQPPFEFSTLRTDTWSRSSSEWISATPIALPKNPGRLTSGSSAARAKAWAAAEEQVQQSCIHVGLPEPVAVFVSLDPLMPGVRPAAHYPAFVQGARRGDGVRRRLVHAAVRFDQDVSGPLVLGSGRFVGLGLMRPARRHNSAAGGAGPQVSDES